MSAAKGESPFGTREWVSTRELAVVYGQTVDFWQKLAKAGAFESKRNGLGPRAHLSINVSSFLTYWNSRETGAAPCPNETISGSSKGAASWYARKRRKGQEFETSLYTADKATGRERAKRWVERLIAEEWGEKPPRTFDEAMTRYADERFGSLADKTAKRYAASIEHLHGHFQGMPLAKITASTLMDFERKRRQEVKPADRSPGSLLPVLHLRDGAALGVGRDEPRPAVPRGARQDGPHGRRRLARAISPATKKTRCSAMPATPSAISSPSTSTRAFAAAS